MWGGVKVLEGEGGARRSSTLLIVEYGVDRGEGKPASRHGPPQKVSGCRNNFFGDGPCSIWSTVFEENWEKFAKSAIEPVEKEFMKACAARRA